MSNSALNATKRGCCAVDARLLPGESEKEYRNVERIWNESCQPGSTPNPPIRLIGPKKATAP
jgi:hypothetical protein